MSDTVTGTTRELIDALTEYAQFVAQQNGVTYDHLEFNDPPELMTGLGLYDLQQAIDAGRRAGIPGFAIFRFGDDYDSRVYAIPFPQGELTARAALPFVALIQSQLARIKQLRAQQYTQRDEEIRREHLTNARKLLGLDPPDPRPEPGPLARALLEHGGNAGDR